MPPQGCSSESMAFRAGGNLLKAAATPPMGEGEEEVIFS